MMTQDIFILKKELLQRISAAKLTRAVFNKKNQTGLILLMWGGKQTFSCAINLETPFKILSLSMRSANTKTNAYS